nr:MULTISPECIES: TauD/TfdA family dioxygenase [unclassified Salipiger]
MVIGQLRPIFFGDYFDAKTHINPTNTAYTASGHELHTDTPAEALAPGVQFLHCRANTVEGDRVSPRMAWPLPRIPGSAIRRGSRCSWRCQPRSTPPPRAFTAVLPKIWISAPSPAPGRRVNGCRTLWAKRRCRSWATMGALSSGRPSCRLSRTSISSTRQCRR